MALIELVLTKNLQFQLNIYMFKMFAIICAVTVLECNTMYENPPRTFETKEQCLEAAVIKEKATIEMLSDEDGYLVVEHLEVGCEQVNNT
mgnify:CR=1 FL=1